MAEQSGSRRTLTVGGVIIAILGVGWFVLSHAVIGTPVGDAAGEALGVMLALLVVGSVIGAVIENRREHRRS